MNNNLAIRDDVGGITGPLPVIHPKDWTGKQAPDRVWVLPGWLPAYRATLLTGDGGSGKSLLAQQWCTCAALGLPFMGIPMRQQNALYITCEDDPSELWRRQEGINAALGVSMDRLQGSLTFLSRAGELSNSLLHFGSEAEVMVTDFYHDIVKTADLNSSFFLVLDNIAHLFEGNENIRNHVAIFCNLMEMLAREIGGTVLFLGHPPKNGAQFSGSTAWENQVRSRLFLERPDNENDFANANLRTLSKSKSNYSSVGDKIEMQWQDWAFLRHDDDRINWDKDMIQTGKATAENDLFLKFLELRIDQRRAVSASPHAQNYAPKAFVKMPGAKGKKADVFEAAMERLFNSGQIETGELWKGADRKYVIGLRRAGRLRDGSAASISETPETRTNTSEAPCGPVAGHLNQVEQATDAGHPPPPIGGVGGCPASVATGEKNLQPESGRDFDAEWPL